MTQLDELTRVRVAAVLTNAVTNGYDRTEALHRAQLLWTPHRERETKVKILKYIVQEMTTWRPAEFMRSINRSTSAGTPADMHRAVVAWIEKHIKAIEEAP